MIRQPLRSGDMVETCVYVCGERHPMARGRIVGITHEHAIVDIMSHHGGAPWLVVESLMDLQQVD